jgi:hypothetical protein
MKVSGRAPALGAIPALGVREGMNQHSYFSKGEIETKRGLQIGNTFL